MSAARPASAGVSRLRPAGTCGRPAIGPAARAGRRLAVLSLLLALVAGCSRDEPPLLAPPAELPAPVAEVFPAARSSRVMYDTEIWVRFSEPLDPATIDERTVFLKLDTVRNPVTLAYDAPSRTLRLTPRVRLALLRTYTVEITRGVTTAAGRPLDQGYFWQFTTNGLRRLETSIPESGTTGESPFVTLRWGGTEPTAGSIRYEVYAGADSAVIAARGLPAIGAVTEGIFIPRVRWGTGVVRYWAVSSANLTTGERIEGPVWRFETLPSATPVDSVVVPIADWAYYFASRLQVVCMGPAMDCFPNSNNGIRWQIPQDPDLRLAGARLYVSVTGSGDFNLAPYLPHIQALGDPWVRCAINAIFPRGDGRGPLAGGTQIGTTRRARFEGDAFTAHLETGARFGYGHGYRLWANLPLSYASPTATTSPLTDPVLTLYYYRVGSAAGRAARVALP